MTTLLAYHSDPAIRVVTVPLSRLRVILDPSDPCELLVIGPDDHPRRGEVLAWIRNHALKVTGAEVIVPIMMGAYVMGFRIGGDSDCDLCNLVDAMLDEHAGLTILWRSMPGETSDVWIGDLT